MNEQKLKSLQECLSEIAPLARKLAAETDFRLVAAILISEAATLLQAGISAGILTPGKAIAFFSGGIEVALEPRATKAAVMHYDDDGINYGTKQ